jgi:hypothetical protein
VARHRPARPPRHWDARGARLTAVLPDGRASYDGRATKEENFSERTGLAVPDGEALRAEGDAPVATARYLDVLPLPGGGHRLYYESPLPDGSHELRTELVPADPPASEVHRSRSRPSPGSATPGG